MRAMPSVTRLRLGFDAAVAVLFAVTAYQSLDFDELARMFPLSISIGAVLLALVNFSADFLRWRRMGSAVSDDVAETAVLTDDREGIARGLANALRYLSWFVGYVALIWLVGLLVATVVFLGAFLVVEARARLWLIMVGPVVAVIGLVALTTAMNLELPDHFIHFW